MTSRQRRWGIAAACRVRVRSTALGSAALLPVTLIALLSLPLTASLGESKRAVSSAPVAQMATHGNAPDISGGQRLDFSPAASWRRAAVASAPSVNSRLRPFKVDFIYNRNPARPGTLQLTGFYLFPFFPGFEVGPFGGCAMQRLRKFRRRPLRFDRSVRPQVRSLGEPARHSGEVHQPHLQRSGAGHDPHDVDDEVHPGRYRALYREFRRLRSQRQRWETCQADGRLPSGLFGLVREGECCQQLLAEPRSQPTDGAVQPGGPAGQSR